MQRRARKAYTVSDMMTSLNQSAEQCGATVELKRVGKTEGTAYNTTDAEIKELDTKARMKFAAQSLVGLSTAQKLSWAIDHKNKGNKLYKDEKFQDAADIYLEALTALDSYSMDSDAQKAKRELQLPILCNLAACLLSLKKWQAVVEMCNEAIKLDENCLKAFCRRANAYTHLRKFTIARFDLAKAALLEGEDPLVKRCEKLLENAEKNHALQQRKQKAMAQRMMKGSSGSGGLYADKRSTSDPTGDTQSTLHSSSGENSSPSTDGFYSLYLLIAAVPQSFHCFMLSCMRRAVAAISGLWNGK